MCVNSTFLGHYSLLHILMYIYPKFYMHVRMYNHNCIYVRMYICIACLCIYVCCLVVQLAPSLQAFFMLFFSADLILRLQWRPFFYFHQRTFFKVRTYILTYINMYVRMYMHIRITNVTYIPVYCSMLCILKLVFALIVYVCVHTYVCS